MLKYSILIVISLLLSLATQAQESNSVFHFLKLPHSAHAAALGGENVSIIEDDLTMAIQNPALLSCVADKTLNLNYMLYIDGVNVAGAAFSRMIGDRSSWAISAQYVGYGTLKETTEENIEIGSFSAKDMVMSGIYSYDLSDYWSGGVKANLIYSNYEKYSSFAIGVDLGLNYYDQSSDFSASLVARNLGGQLVAFDDKREKLPADLQIGFTKRMAHAPFRLSLTFYNLTNWKSYPLAEKKEKFVRKFLNHTALGLDFLPTNNLYLSLGFNFRQGYEMKIADSSHWAGLTAGAGIQVKRFKLGMAYSKYHISSSSLTFNLSLTL